MTNEQLFSVMRQVILNVTGVPQCIMANPNKPSPSGEYCAVQPKQYIEQRGQANINRTSTAGIASVVNDVRAQLISTCNVNFYRGKALDYAHLLMQANKLPSVSELLFRNSIGWNRAGPVNNLTVLKSGNQEPRAQLNIYLMFETSISDTINSIERVSFTVEDEKANILASEEIETPDAP